MAFNKEVQVSDVLMVIGWIAGIVSAVAVLVVSLCLYILREFKNYCAERFANADKRCDKCAEHNTDEHKNLHSRIDEHIRDHANKNK